MDNLSNMQPVSMLVNIVSMSPPAGKGERAFFLNGFSYGRVSQITLGKANWLGRPQLYTRAELQKSILAVLAYKTCGRPGGHGQSEQHAAKP